MCYVIFKYTKVILITDFYTEWRDFILKYDRGILIDNISKLMNDNDISQSDLANISGTHQSRISECLNGKKDFTLPQIIEISNCFNVSIDALLGRPDSTNYNFDSLSDICSLLFSLSDSIHCHISREYIEEGEAYQDELAYHKTGSIDAYLNTPSELVSIPATKGDYCIVFEDAKMQAFLEEWSEANHLFKLLNGKTLYDTWKQGVISKYSQILKIYSYNTRHARQLELAEQKLKYCLTEDSTTEDSYKILSDKFYNTLNDTDLELLKEYESKVEKLYGSFDELPFLPDIEPD